MAESNLGVWLPPPLLLLKNCRFVQFSYAKRNSLPDIFHQMKPTWTYMGRGEMPCGGKMHGHLLGGRGGRRRRRPWALWTERVCGARREVGANHCLAMEEFTLHFLGSVAFLVTYWSLTEFCKPSQSHPPPPHTQIPRRAS